MANDKKRPIKLNDQQLMLMASNVADLYHQLSNDLFDNVVDRLKERGTYYLDQQPYLWQLEKLNDMGILNDHNVQLMAEYSGIAEEQIRYIIENEGYKVYTDTMEQLGAGAYDNRVMEDLISYANQAVNDVSNLINTTLPTSVQVVYKSIVEESVAKVVTGMATSETALNETIMKWHAKGFYGYTDRAGRRQRADSYARTVIKTTVARVNNEMRTRPAEELGIDTFYYSIKAAARELCAPIQNKIVTTGRARTEAGHKIYALSDYGYGRPEGCRGINCSHIMTPFIPGVNYLPDIDDDLKGLTPEQAIENANAQAKQRALERSIRFTKEQIHVAEKLGDMELIDRYKMKLGNQKRALKSWLDDHSFLYRDRGREKYYDNPKKQIREEINQRKLRIRIRSEYRKIKKVLGDFAPKTLTEFQKMGYNNTKEYRQLLLKSELQEHLNNGSLSLQINKDKQNRHLLGHRTYEDYVARNRSKNKPIPGYMLVDNESVQKIIDENYLKGRLVKRQEGQYSSVIKIDSKSGVAFSQSDLSGDHPAETNEFTIHISKSTTHLVPRMPSDEKNGE